MSLEPLEPQRLPTTTFVRSTSVSPS